jgi:MFS transporter, YNFM family, putative membrane transport protein
MSQADRASVARASPHDGAMPRSSFRALARSLLIGHIAFLTLVDLFSPHSSLTHARLWRCTRVNASTLGMAVASLAAAFFSQRLDRRRGIILSLALLAIPTLLLAFAPNLAVFAALRIAQGLCMASAFTLTLAYLGERCSTSDTAGAFAAYVTGSVASNLFGRLISAAVAGHFGLASSVREGCATLHSSAARVKLSNRATARKYRTWCISIGVPAAQDS